MGVGVGQEDAQPGADLDPLDGGAPPALSMTARSPNR
jgi:hypothetical protein